MGHITSDDHRLGPESRSIDLGDRASRGTSELCVDLHQNFGHILWIALGNMARLQNLRGHTPAAIAGLLDTEIGEGVLVGYNDQEQLRILLKFDASVVVHSLDGLSDVLLEFQNQGPPHDVAAMAGVTLHEGVAEILHLVAIDDIALTGEKANGPRVEWLPVRLVKLLAAQIPAAVGARVVTLISAELDLRVWQQAGFGADHVLADLEAECAKDGIVIVREHRLGRSDGCETLVGTISGILDHRTGLPFSKLVRILLKAVDSENFHRVDNAFLGHLNHRQIVVIKNQVVLVLEIRAHGDLVRLAGGLVGDINQVLFGVGIDETLHGEGCVRDRATAVVRAHLKFLQALVHLKECMGLGGSAHAVGDRSQKCHEMLMITAIKNGHGSPHEGGARPEAGVGDVDVDNKAAALKSR